MARPLDRYTVADFKQGYETVVEVKQGLPHHLAQLFLHCTDFLNHEVSRHRTPGAETPLSVLRAVKLNHVFLALLLSTDGQFSRRDRFLAMKRGNIGVMLPWLMAYTEAAGVRGRWMAGSTSTADIYKNVGAAYRHKWGISNPARALLSNELASANEDTYGKVSAKVGQEDAPALAAAKTAP